MTTPTDQTMPGGTFYGIGLGPGDPELVTLRAVRILRDVEVIFHVAGANSRTSISGSIIADLNCRARQVELQFSMAPAMAERRQAWLENAAKVVAELRQGHHCAFVTIGDPLIYSTYSYLLREIQALLPQVKVETVPGITAFQAAAARLNQPLVEDQEVLTVIPAWTAANAEHPAWQQADTMVFLKTYRHRQQILETLRTQAPDAHITYAARLGLDDELITQNLDELAAAPDEYLSLLIVKRNAPYDNRAKGCA